MKPLRNQIFCYGCRKHKMLFETQAKADNFIRYNSEGILEENGKAPVRSYYCEMCGGYHVTSNPSKEMGERLNQRDHLRLESLSNYKKEIEEVKALSSLLSQRLVDIKALLFFGEVQEAEDLLDICKLDIDELSSHQFRGNGKLTTLRGKVDKMFALLASVKNLFNLSEEEKAALLTTPCTDKEQYTLGIILSNIQIINKIDSMLAENESQFANNSIGGIPERLHLCRQLILTIQRAGKKEVTRKYNELFQEQEALVNKIVARSRASVNELATNEGNRTKQTSPVQYIDKQEYKKTILAIIERIEIIRKAIKEKDYDTCETQIEIGYYMLDELNVKDDNTELIQQQLDQLGLCLKEKIRLSDD